MEKEDFVFFEKLRELCKSVGWVMGIHDEKDGVSGVIIGKADYVENILKSEEEFDEYAIYSPTEHDNGEIH